MIHELIHIRDYETGAVVWACSACDFVCIHYNGHTTPIVYGDKSVYHMFPEELEGNIPGHAASHEHNGVDFANEFDEYCLKYGDVVKTAFFWWIAEHAQELEDL